MTTIQWGTLSPWMKRVLQSTIGTAPSAAARLEIIRRQPVVVDRDAQPLGLGEIAVLDHGHDLAALGGAGAPGQQHAAVVDMDLGREAAAVKRPAPGPGRRSRHGRRWAP